MVNTKYQVVNGDSWFLMMRKKGLYHRGDLFCGLSHPLKEQESLWRTRECIYIYVYLYAPKMFETTGHWMEPKSVKIKFGIHASRKQHKIRYGYSVVLSPCKASL
jgi:hypothetical protein